MAAQFTAELRIENGNPTWDTLRADFARFGLSLNPSGTAIEGPITLLGTLNDHRNHAAHQKRGLPRGRTSPLTLAEITAWRSACDAIAAWLADLLYNHFKKGLRVVLW